MSICLIARSLYSQEYNYQHVGHSNATSNPSSLTNSEFSDRIVAYHTNNFPVNRAFQKAEIHLLKSLKDGIYGVGIGHRTLLQDQRWRYHSTRVSAAYRTMVMAKLVVRLGASLKVNNERIVGSFYSFYSNQPVVDATLSSVHFNGDLTGSISDRRGRFILTGGTLNRSFSILGFSNSLAFPSYSFVELGNILKWINPGTKNELSVSYQSEHSFFSGTRYHNIFIYAAQQPALQIDRNLSLSYTARIGILFNRWVQLNPRIALTTRKTAFWVGTDHAILSNQAVSAYKTAITIGITRKLSS